MAIFTSDNRKSQGPMATTVIAAGTFIRGEIELTCNLHLDGEVNGQIKADHAIRIGRDGKIVGETKADSLVVAGKVDGIVEAKVVEIVEDGLIEGTVYCDELIIAKGGHFLGESKPLKEHASASNNIMQLKSDVKDNKELKKPNSDSALASKA